MGQACLGAGSDLNYVACDHKGGKPTLDHPTQFPKRPEYHLDPDDIPHLHNTVGLCDWIFYHTVSRDPHPNLFIEFWNAIDKIQGNWFEKPDTDVDEFRRNYFTLNALGVTDSINNRLVTWSLVTCKSLKTVYLVFRGTVDALDVSLDFSYMPYSDPSKIHVSEENLHSGYCVAIQSVLGDIFNAMNQLNTDGEMYKFYVTGQSMGGGMAQIFWKHYEYRQHRNLSFQKVLTYAAPMMKWHPIDPQDVAFLKKNNTDRKKDYVVPPHMMELNGIQFDDRCINIINNNDIIPCLPFAGKFSKGDKSFVSSLLKAHPVARLGSSILESLFLNSLRADLPDVYLGWRPLGITLRIVDTHHHGTVIQDLSHDFTWFMKDRYYSANDHSSGLYIDAVNRAISQKSNIGVYGLSSKRSSYSSSRVSSCSNTASHNSASNKSVTGGHGGDNSGGGHCTNSFGCHCSKCCLTNY